MSGRLWNRVLAGLWLAVILAAARAFAGPDLRLVEAARNQDRDAVRSLLQQKVDVNAPQGDGATALSWAAHWDDLEMADLLLAAGANVNAANDYGITPLWLACVNRSPAMVDKLLAAGANPNAATWTGETALMTAAATGNLAIVRSLLDHGADVNAKEPARGQTALMWAIAEGHPEVARLLIERGADIRARTHRREGFSPMVIRGYGGSIEATPEGGYTPLLFAARVGDLETARLLVAKGADVNESTPQDGNTLVVASAGGFEELALFLLEQGADPNSRDASGITPLHYALRDGLKVLHGIDIVKVQRICASGAGARCVAVDPDASPDALKALTPFLEVPAQQLRGQYSRSSEILDGSNMLTLAKALLARGADPNAQLQRPPARLRLRRKPLLNLTGATPFLLAAAAEDLVAMRMLVEGRAKTNIKTVVDPAEFFKEGYGDDNQIQGNGSPFLVAAGLGRTDDFAKQEERKALEALKTMVGLGADVNEASDTGWTAMHAAAFLGANEIIRFLAEQGANVNVRNGCGQTPLSLAEGTDARGLLSRVTPHPETAKLLRQLGAVPDPGVEPVGRCVEGRFGLDYATVNSDVKKEREKAVEKVIEQRQD
ncbi:MAG TPA: ankyrin repeat domain-containing protein [Terriglobia bacterium]|nr:ankyrin repeat domain-containing protein [Terriglobia bacterium]